MGLGLMNDLRFSLTMTQRLLSVAINGFGSVMKREFGGFYC